MNIVRRPCRELTHGLPTPNSSRRITNAAHPARHRPTRRHRPTPIQWLWPGRVPLGKLTLLVGYAAVGKSLLGLDLAARVSAGIHWPDAPDTSPPPAGVILLSTEDGLADTVRPRLDAAGADHDRITAITAVRRNILSPLPMPLRATCLMPGLPHLDAAIQNTPECRLVLIDPLTRSFGQSNHSSHADTRAVLEPLADLAARRNVAVVAIYQAARTATGFAVQKMIAKLSPGAARTVCALVPDSDAADRRLFLSVKNTVAEPSPPLACRIANSEQHQAPSIIWDDVSPDISTDAALGRRDPREDQIDAREWLRDALARGPVKAKHILEQADDIGFSHRTIRRAFRQIKALRARIGYSSFTAWVWALPQHNEQFDQFDP